MEKCVVRKKALAKRKGQIIDITQYKLKLDKYLNGKKIVGIYYPLQDEINLLPLIDLYKEITFVFPKTNHEIEFRYVDAKGFKKGKFNLSEPQGKVIDKNDIDLIIVPALAINKKNHRIGYGKGYYDSYLKDYLNETLVLIKKEFVFDFEPSKNDVIIKEVFLL